MTLREQLDELAPDQIAARLAAIFRAKLAEFDHSSEPNRRQPYDAGSRGTTAISGGNTSRTI